MTTSRNHALKFPLADGTVLRTADDNAYAWQTFGRHKGWSRTRRPDQHTNTAVMLMPKNLERSLAGNLLDCDVKELQETDLNGAVLLLPGSEPTAEVKQLLELRRARTTGATLPLTDVTLARGSAKEIGNLTDEHGMAAGARALRLQSLPAREKLIQQLGSDVVAKILNQHPEIPEEITMQIMRSTHFNPNHLDLPEKRLRSLVGNPNLTPETQVGLVKQLCVDAEDPASERALLRALSCTSLPEEAAAWIVGRYEALPHTIAVALAENPSATWPWLRHQLDQDTHPAVALASRQVGVMSASRLATLAAHPDPVVRRSVGEQPEPAEWSWWNRGHRNVLDAVDDPFSYREWSLQPGWVEPEDWGAYTVARQWAARAEELPEAEKALRAAANLHNRSWGALGRGLGDPERAARAEADKVLAMTDPNLRLLSLAPAESYTVEEARMRAVQMVAAREGNELHDSDSPLVHAVLTACAAEADHS